MGVFQKRGTKFWWMSYTGQDGKRRWESTLQTDKRSAQDVLDATLAAISGNTAAPARGPMTIARFADLWEKELEERGLETLAEYKQRIRDYIKPQLGAIVLADWESRQTQAFVRGLKKTISKRTGRLLAPRTVRHIYSVLHQLNEAAKADGRMKHDACVLKRGDLPSKVDRDPLWRAGAVFRAEEVELLISAPEIPLDRRVWYALHFLTGMRPSETSAIQWRDYDTRAPILGRITVAKAMDRGRTRVKGTKTGTVREIPVHPTLAAMLAEWKLGGWQDALLDWRSRTGSAHAAPTLDDLIIPSREGKSRGNSITGKRFHQDLKRLGLRQRRAYDTRRTFASVAQGHGAPRDVVRWFTHPPTEQLDEYTTLPWETRCAAIRCIRIERLEGKVLDLRRESIRSESQGQEIDPVTDAVTDAPSNKKPAESQGLGGQDEAGCTGLERVAGLARERRRADGVRALAELRAEAGAPKREDRPLRRSALSRCHGGIGGRPRPLVVAVRRGGGR